MAVQQPTKLEYYDNMWKLESKSTILSYFQSEDGRRVLNVESTIFHPQGGGQPSDTGFIVFRDSQLKFIVHDVRSKDGVVFHYGEFEGAENEETEVEFQKGMKVDLQVDGSRRRLNSRLHSAGHLLDACMRKVGLGHLEPSKGYHFSDGPFVEYKGTVPQSELQCKREKLELEANALISRGGTVYAATLPYDEAAQLCDSHLPDYISKGSTPRIVKLGDNPGCPCGGTHVHDISDIKSVKSENEVFVGVEDVVTTSDYVQSAPPTKQATYSYDSWWGWDFNAHITQQTEYMQYSSNCSWTKEVHTNNQHTTEQLLSSSNCDWDKNDPSQCQNQFPVDYSDAFTTDHAFSSMCTKTSRRRPGSYVRMNNRELILQISVCHYLGHRLRRCTQKN